MLSKNKKTPMPRHAVSVPVCRYNVKHRTKQ